MNKRVKYNRCPLVEVIFQLRFPTILSINSKQPADFQEKIRKEYPFYDEGIEEQNELLINTNGKSAQLKSSQNKNYSFVSVDKTYKVNLTSTFIAISTRKYTQWEEFSEKVRQVVKAFQETYEVPFYTRVGLRYIDVIQSSFQIINAPDSYKCFIRNRCLHCFRIASSNCLNRVRKVASCMSHAVCILHTSLIPLQLMILFQAICH